LLKFCQSKFQKPIDFWRKSAIIIIVKREEDNGDSPMEKYSTSKISKEILKTLLTATKIGGIIRMSRGDVGLAYNTKICFPWEMLEKIFQRNLKNPLTDPAECGIIRVSRGVRNRIWLR
jgi:hypothetical protein